MSTNKLRVKIKALMSSDKTIRQALADACAERTRNYFRGVTFNAGGFSARAIEAARVIHSRYCGVNRESLAEVAGAILGENIGYLVQQLSRPEPNPGVMFNFLSERVDPGKRVLALAIEGPAHPFSKTECDDIEARFINLHEPGQHHSLNTKSINGALEPGADEIHTFFAQLDKKGIRLVLGSTFGVEVLG